MGIFDKTPKYKSGDEVIAIIQYSNGKFCKKAMIVKPMNTLFGIKYRVKIQYEKEISTIKEKHIVDYATEQNLSKFC